MNNEELEDKIKGIICTSQGACVYRKDGKCKIKSCGEVKLALVRIMELVKEIRA